MSGEMKKTGTLYGIGTGPGDPELLTLKAVRILGTVPVLAYPEQKRARAWPVKLLRLIYPISRRKLRLSCP